MLIPCARTSYGGWGRFYKEVENVRFSILALEALRWRSNHGIPRGGKVLDLGAGAMTDSRYFLEEGFQTCVAVDPCKEAAEYAARLGSKPGMIGRLEFRPESFSEFFAREDHVEGYHHVHAGFSLPYHGRIGFSSLMAAATDAVMLGQTFSGTFFGTDDEWNGRDDLPFFTPDEVRDFFPGFNVTVSERRWKGFVNGDEGSPVGTLVPKHWHVIEAIGQRVTSLL